MTVRIIYPEVREVSDDIIAGWFADAVTDGLIASEYLNAQTIKEMSTALDDAGLIALA